MPLYSVSPSEREHVGHENAVYLTSWSIAGGHFRLESFPFHEITHLMYAFAGVTNDGTVLPFNDRAEKACIRQLASLKQHNRSLKVLLSIGGQNTHGASFASFAPDDRGRQNFAATAIQLMATYGFDGIDIDWEFPRNDREGRALLYLLEACRAALDAYSTHNQIHYRFLLTIAAPAGPHNYRNLPLRRMDRTVDQWHLMTYDYAGAWSTEAGHHALLEPAAPHGLGVRTTVEDYIAKGVSPAKIVLGMPLYGRSFSRTRGIGRPCDRSRANESGTIPYKDLVGGAAAGMTEYWDPAACATYGYYNNAQQLVSYESVASVEHKARYIRQRGPGSGFFWEASGDSREKSLVKTLRRNLGVLEQSQNLVHFPGYRRGGSSVYGGSMAYGVPGQNMQRGADVCRRADWPRRRSV